MSATVMAVAAGIDLGSRLIGGIRRRKKEKDRRKQRTNFFNNELSPLLNQEFGDVDYSSLREADLIEPTLQFQNQMNDLSRSRDASMGKSGFNQSGFIEQEFNRESQTLNTGLDVNTFNVDRSIIDLQSQLRTMATENQIRAKELEYQYKYG